MKKIKQLNGWVIKEKSLNEVPNWVNDNRRYAIFSPTGVFLEDNLLFSEAIEWAELNHDNVLKPKTAKFTLDEFKKFISEGYWFNAVNGYLVYLKLIDEDAIVSLWLSAEDTTGMHFAIYSKSEWSWNEEEQKFYTFGAGVYHFGSVEDIGSEDSIYNEEGDLIEDKMFSIILNAYENIRYSIVKESQLKNIWNALKNKEDLHLRTLNVFE